jgi:hypothetical protein
LKDGLPGGSGIILEVPNVANLLDFGAPRRDFDATTSTDERDKPN